MISAVATVVMLISLTAICGTLCIINKTLKRTIARQEEIIRRQDQLINLFNQVWDKASTDAQRMTNSYRTVASDISQLKRMLCRQDAKAV